MLDDFTSLCYNVHDFMPGATTSTATVVRHSFSMKLAYFEQQIVKGAAQGLQRSFKSKL